MNYELDISKLIKQVANKFQVYGNSIEFITSVLQPSKTLNDQFVDKVEELRIKNQYNSQKLSLEARLNNLFDPVSRRIYIETIPPLFVEFIYSADNTAKTYFYSATNEEKYYAYKHSTYEGLAALGINFVVYVSPDVLSSAEKLIAKEVAFYALAGKNWIIRSTNEIIDIPEFGE